MISRSTDFRSALKSKQRGFLLNPYRFGTGGGGGGTDPNFSSVSLLLYGNGSNGGTTFTDSSGSPKTVTGFGNAQTSTAQSVYGGSSILLDGTGDYLSTPANAGFIFGTGDFTIETYARFSSLASTQFLLYSTDIASIGSATQAYRIFFDSGTGKISFSFISSALAYLAVEATTVISANTWYYIAVTRTGGNLRIFINGTLETTLGSAGAAVNDPAGIPLLVGRGPNSSPAYFNGNLSMIRITKGVARWTATYTPETLPFPAS